VCAKGPEKREKKQESEKKKCRGRKAQANNRLKKGGPAGGGGRGLQGKAFPAGEVPSAQKKLRGKFCQGGGFARSWSGVKDRKRRVRETNNGFRGNAFVWLLEKEEQEEKCR